jgi:hypothetical protein
VERRDTFGLKGFVELVLVDKEGGIVGRRESPNMIVYNGNDLIRDCVGQGTGQPAGAQWIAIGTGTVSAAGTDTALGTESARTSGTYAEAETGGGYKDQWTEQCTFGAGVGTGNISESGCFNANSGGTMLCRQTFTAIPKGASDSLQITWTFTITNP